MMRYLRDRAQSAPRGDMDLALEGSAHSATRRSLLAAAVAGLAAPQALALETLVITAVNKGGSSAVAARLLTEIYRRAGLGLQIDVLPPPRTSLLTLSDKA